MNRKQCAITLIFGEYSAFCFAFLTPNEIETAAICLHCGRMEWQKGKFLISDDQSRLNLDFVIQGLNSTYWASHRSADLIRKSIPNSMCFGVYRCGEEGNGAQVGFARVVTDGCTFSWLCDVYIAPAFRGEGLGTWLVDCIVSHPVIKPTNKVLATQDAHGLYERFGFARREMMQKRG